MNLILVGVLALVVILFFRMTLRTVPQAHVMIIERLGRYHRTLQSGLSIVLPMIDKPSPFLMRRQGQAALQNHVDMREMVLGLDSEQVITRDNVGMGVGSVIYYQVIDPVKAKYEIQDVGYAIDQLTRTNLRNLMGGLTLDESLTSRDHVNVRLREVLDEASEKWGVKVTRVEIREIDPPKSIQDSMALQMQAERERLRGRGRAREGGFAARRPPTETGFHRRRENTGDELARRRPQRCAAQRFKRQGGFSLFSPAKKSIHS